MVSSVSGTGGSYSVGEYRVSSLATISSVLATADVAATAKGKALRCSAVSVMEVTPLSCAMFVSCAVFELCVSDNKMLSSACFSGCFQLK